MSIAKIKGIETEWSIVLRDKDGSRPAEAGDFYKMINVIKEYLGLPVSSREESIQEVENIDRVKLIQRYDEEDLPLKSIFDFGLYSHHNLLPNGGRLYIDGPHLEYSTPECLSAKTLVAADRAGEIILGLARMAVNEELNKNGLELVVYKDNTDRRGNSYGCHENYLVSREAFERIINPASLDVGQLAAFFICRLIFTGAGKMGIEQEKRRLSDSIFQISQRADFIAELLHSCTIKDRSIINSRDEPLADAGRFARLHVIVGDANLAEIATYMKVGITSIILKMMEDGFLRGDIVVGNPVEGIKLASQDLTCRKPVLETLGGRKLSSLNLSEEFFQRAKDYFSRVSEPSLEESDLMRLWEETNSDFYSGNKARLRRRFDWQIKLGLFEDFLEDLGFTWQDIEKAKIRENGHTRKVATHFYFKDILYHNINKEEGLYRICKEDGEVEGLVSSDEVINLIKNPPPECRSYFRGRCIAKFFDDINMADWDELIFKEKIFKRNKNFSILHTRPAINLSNPIWGGRNDAEEILNGSSNYEDLLAELKKIEQ